MSNVPLKTFLVCSGAIVACVVLVAIWAMNNSKDSTMQPPDEWPPAIIGCETEIYLFEPDVKPDGDIFSIRSRNLVSIRDAVCSVLVDILKDGSNVERLTTPIQGEEDVHNLPIQRVCFLLRSNVPDEIVPLLIPFAKNSDARVRKAVAFPLGESGHDSSMVTVINLLGDTNDEVVESVCHGLISAGDLSDQYQLALINCLEQSIQTNSSSDKLCHLLVWQPHKEATSVINRLLKKPNLDPNTILINLSGSPTTADRGALLALLADRENMSHEEHVSEALFYLLILIGRHSHPDDERLLRGFIDDASERVVLGAAAGLLDWYGLGDFPKWLYSYESLPNLSLLQVRNMMNTKEMINKYGVTESFWDLEVDECQSAVSGLQLIGAVEGAEILAAAIDLAADENSRDDQWQELEARWKPIRRRLDVQLYLYVIEHRGEFLAISPQSAL